MKCPNCGQEFNGDRCPNCGRPVSKGSSRTAAVIILILFVIPAALFGACSTLLSLDSLGRPNSGGGPFFAMGLVALAAVGGGLFLVVKLWRN